MPKGAPADGNGRDIKAQLGGGIISQVPIQKERRLKKGAGLWGQVSYAQSREKKKETSQQK